MVSYYKLTYSDLPVMVEMAAKDGAGNTITDTYLKTDFSNAAIATAQAGKYLKVSTTGGIEYDSPAGGVADVELDGTSIVDTDGVAQIVSADIVEAAGLAFEAVE